MQFSASGVSSLPPLQRQQGLALTGVAGMSGHLGSIPGATG